VTRKMLLSPRQRALQVVQEQRIERERASRPPTPERITMALDLAELFGPEVDAALGVEEPTVDLWESGELVPTRAQVEALARLTDMGVGWFWLPKPGPISVTVCGEGGCETVEKWQPAETPAEVIQLFRTPRLCGGGPAREFEVTDPFLSDPPTLF
jgi:DNA-binding transcriptional regulator YiaG